MAEPFLPDALRVHPLDDVLVALRDLQPGETVRCASDVIVARAQVPRGHKIAVGALAAGSLVRKYGWPIGRATRDIAPGEHVHTHNLATTLTAHSDYTYTPPAPVAQPAGNEPRTFMGYRRRNGRVGTRNELWIVCTVGCVARTARRIADAADERLHGKVDGVYALTHPFGCSQLGDDLAHTRRILASLVSHPNAGGVLVVGLGCENNQLAALLGTADFDSERVRSFNAQTVGDEVEEGVRALEELAEMLARDVREPRPLSDLVLGLKCGGSDAFSGLTANPLVGRISSELARAGGTPILTEIPETFGAEQLLMARAVDREVFEAVGTLVNDFKHYFTAAGQPVSENPSPGNLAGGITTLEEKSLGAVQKAGEAPLTQVLRYGERVHRPGLALLEAPGNDAVSGTALAAAGATLLLFTTGRGTPLGFPAPTLKISTNTPLAQAKPRWIDFDAGTLLTGAAMEERSRALLDLIIATASGRQTCAERNGERELAIWKTGVTL
ncbi:MAG TPA: altronate dehydratase family protein [Steroidobacteraceae bacterium]|jgi:altronate hydrolase|nr:altronate dehydratase family protein [Steroidobacteraceae bacterium]